MTTRLCGGERGCIHLTVVYFIAHGCTEDRERSEAAGAVFDSQVHQRRQAGLFSDGAAVRSRGEKTFRVAKRYEGDTLTVTTDEICQAFEMGSNDTHQVMESAGALAIAGVLKYVRNKGLVGYTVRCTVLA